MKLSNSSISSLKDILKTLYGLEISDEEAQLAGISILRFIASKQLVNVEKSKKVYDENVYIT